MLKKHKNVQLYKTNRKIETVFVVLLLNAVKTDRKEDRRKREMKEQERRVQQIILLFIFVLFSCSNPYEFGQVASESMEFAQSQ